MEWEQAKLLLKRMGNIQVILLCSYIVFLVETCTDRHDREVMIKELQEIKTVIEESN